MEKYKKAFLLMYCPNVSDPWNHEHKVGYDDNGSLRLLAELFC